MYKQGHSDSRILLFTAVACLLAVISLPSLLMESRGSEMTSTHEISSMICHSGVNSPTHKFSFEETSGTTVYDSGSNPVNGNRVGASINQQGISGKCYFFDGTTNYIEFPSDSSFSFTNQVSLSVWIKPNKYGMGIMGRTFSTSSPWSIYKLISYVDGTIRFVVANSALTGFAFDCRTTTTIPQNQWTMITGVYTGSTSTSKIYFNGTSQSLQLVTGSGGNMGSSSEHFSIGYNPTYETHGFSGYLDEANVYNYALNASEVSQLFNNVVSPIPNNAPILNSGSVSPGSGTPSTTFTYTVTYSDADNNAPSYVRVYIDGTYYSMSKQNSGDVTYTDGCVYVYSRTLAPASHNYYFSTSDGYVTSTTSTYSGPTVTNNSPTLTSDSVSPVNGNTLTSFTYTVIYTDADNNAPSYMYVYIDGTAYSMSKQNSGDVTYTDGCVYVYSRTLAPASHNYYFYTSDGYVTASTSTYTGPTVTNNAPTLTSGYVSPASGSTSTYFTYTVTYTDADNNAPSYVRVYVDGSYSTMSKQNSGDVTYTDGCVYVYSRTIASGSHNYYFYASDGYATFQTSTYSGPTVQANRAPTLASESVSPSTGGASTYFTFSVTYSDADNNAPSYVRVYIDSTYHDMTKQNSGDNTYTDGVVYEYRATATVGSHSYSFRCSDGSLTTSTTTQSLSVTRYSTTENATTVILVLVFVIGVPLFIGITATKAYNKKKGIKKGKSTSVYRRPSPGFQPAASSPSPYSSRPSGSSGSPLSGFDVTRAARRTDLRALPTPRTSPLARKELVDRARPILKNRQVVGLAIDDAAYGQQAAAYTAAFLARWKAPGEDLVVIPDATASGAASGPSSTDPVEPAVNAAPAATQGGRTPAQEHVGHPVDGAVTHEPPVDVNNAPSENYHLEIADIESQLMGIINPEDNAGQPSEAPSSGKTETEALSEPESSDKPTEATGSPDTSAATPTAEFPKENGDLPKDGDADRQLEVDGPAETKDDPTVGSTESHRKAIDEIDAQLMSLIKHLKGSADGAPRTGTGSPPDDHPSSESDSENDTTPQARDGDSPALKKSEKPEKE